jgi:hypothetical protein
MAGGYGQKSGVYKGVKQHFGMLNTEDDSRTDASANKRPEHEHL